MIYRPDIQGLRAVSVMLVISYHALSTLGKEQYLAGGFLGVDIFMVISGFVIWTVLTEKYKSASFTLVFSFIDGRVRRLLPASLIILYTSVSVGWLTLLPEDLLRLSSSVWASLVFDANGHFATELTDYGAEQARLSPLLHFWSLSVEWKFYIFILFAFVVIPKKSRAVFLLLLIGVSIFLSQVKIDDLNDTSYFTFIGRVWEFCFGAYVADRKMHLTDRSGAVFASLGVLLISVSVLSLSYVADKYAVWHSFPTILGTCFIIISDHKLKIKKFLINKSMVAIGDLSYSLYLWHFLILSFYELLVPKITIMGVFICLALTWVLSKLTRMWIEIPFQAKGRNLAVFYACSVVAIVIIAIWVYNIQEKSGMTTRLGPAENVYTNLNTFGDFKNEMGVSCHNPIELTKPCVYEADDGSDVLFIIGDSHAGSIAAQLIDSELAVNRTIVTYTFNSCPLLKWITVSRSANRYFQDYCRDLTSNVIREIEAYPAQNKSLLYFSRLPLYIEGTGFDNKAGGIEVFNEKFEIRGLLTGDVKRDIAESLNVLSKTVDQMFIISPIPEAGWNVPRQMKVESGLLLSQITEGLRSKSIHVPREVVEQRLASANHILEKLSGNKKIVVIDTLNLFCSSNECFHNGNGQLYYKDSNHLSLKGAGILVNRLVSELLR